MNSNELDKLYAADAKCRDAMQEVRAVIAAADEMTTRLESAARAVVEMRKADDVAFRAAVNVLVTEVLGANAWDSSKGPEVMP